MTQTLRATQAARGRHLAWPIFWRVAAVIGVTLLALALRLRAVEQIPPDFDEDDYLRAGQLYAQHIAAGDLAGVINERENYEHPPLTKLVYGAILYSQGPRFYEQPVAALAGSAMPKGAELERVRVEARPLRSFGALVGTLTVGLVALVSPLAGLLLALNSWHIKYTSQAMLEALPCLFGALTLLGLRGSRRSGDVRFWLAAVTLGLAAAGTYRYGAAGFAALLWLWQRDGGRERVGTDGDRQPLHGLASRPLPLYAAWLALALLAFYLFNPALWPDPLGRLRESILFNTGYSTGAQVREAALPWFQPLVWLLSAVPWHPGVFPLLLDGLFGLLGLLALRRMWLGERLIVLWLLVSLGFLFLWPTKWPQYILALSVPLALAAARWLTDAAAGLPAVWRSRRAAWRSARPALPWLAPALLLFAVVALYPLALLLALAVTNFQLVNLRNGQLTFWEATARGLLSLPPMAQNPLDYYGTGALIFVTDLLPVAFSNTLWVAVSITLAMGLGLWLASLLERPGLRGRKAWRALFILPWAIPEFVSALVWNTLFDDTFGGVNNLLGTKIGWLSDKTPLVDLGRAVRPVSDLLISLRLAPLGESLRFVAEAFSLSKAFWVMCSVSVWICFPFMMLVSIVALRSVPADLYDAARVDGAGRWAIWRQITWPLVRPAVLSGALLRGILLLNAFYIPQMAIGANIGRDTITLALIGYFVTTQSQYSASATISCLVLIVSALLVWLFNRRTHVIQ